MYDSTQVRLGLVDPEKEIYHTDTGSTTTGKDIIKQLKINNIWRADQKGRYAALQYNAQTFKFREGETLTVPVTVANHLRRASAICGGADKLNGPIVPFLEVYDTFEMTEPQKAVKTATCCPICGEDQKTFPRLTRHLGEEKKKHPELFEEKPRDWDKDAKPSKGTATDGDDE